jgi:hypothetical protein
LIEILTNFDDDIPEAVTKIKRPAEMTLERDRACSANFVSSRHEGYVSFRTNGCTPQ